MTVNVITGRAEEILPKIPPASVQLGVTSPPFDGLRTYGGYTWDFELTARELYRVLCPGGVLCWNVNDSVVKGSETLTSCKQKIYFHEAVGFRIHDTMFYAKNNFAHPERVRYHQVVEYVFILSKGEPRCFNPIKDKPNKSAGDPGAFGKNTFAKRDGSRGVRRNSVIADVGMRTNLWIGNTRGQEEFGRKLPQPGMMPRWLARDLIRSWSTPGDTVIDPLAGSGTTGEEAAKLGRNAILIEIDRDQAHRAREGIAARAGLFSEAR